MLALLGGLVQINPVWLWGPYEPFAVTTGAQPDWYEGWLEGALRLFPPGSSRRSITPSPPCSSVLPALTVERVVVVLRISLLVVPVFVGLVARRWARDLAAQEEG